MAVTSRPEQPEPFLRGCLFPPIGSVLYPRADPVDADHLPADVWAAAELPVGMRLEMVGDATAVDIAYHTATANLGYRGEGAGCTFAAYRAARKISEVEAVLGEGVVRLELPGEASRPAIVYLPEGMVPTVMSVTPVGGSIEPAPRRPRWLAYGDAITQGWLASAPSMAWPAVAGRQLGLDVCNLGYAGSARGETFSAAMLADHQAEAISIAYGVNCWSRIPHTPGLLAEGIRAFLAIVRSGQPATPVVVVTPIVRPDAEDTPNRLGATLADLRLAMEEAVHECIAAGDTNLYLVGGKTVMDPVELVDGVHPGDEGHKRLAAAVSRQLSPIVEAMGRAFAERCSTEMHSPHGPGREGAPAGSLPPSYAPPAASYVPPLYAPVPPPAPTPSYAPPATPAYTPPGQEASTGWEADLRR